MSEIIVKNTSVVLEDYTLNSCKPIENFFRMYDPVTYSYFYKGMYYDAENRRLYLPRGIDIWYIEQVMEKKAKILKDCYNEFDIYDDIKIKFLPRDDDQLKALRFMLGRGEYMETQTKSQLSVNLNTGKGKTYVSIASITSSGIKSAIITYSIDVLSQWKKCILQYTNIAVNEIFEISGSGAIFNLMQKSQKEIRKYKIFLVTHATIKSFGDSQGWEAVREFFKHIRIGYKIYDESHTNFDNMCMIDFYSDVYKTFYLSATPARSNPEENRIYQTAFKNILAIDLFKKDVDPHTKYVAIRYHSHPAPFEISHCKGKYGLDRNNYTNHIITNEYFLKAATIVIDLALKIAKEPNEKILIYIGTNNAITTFYSWIIEKFPQLYGQIGIFTSMVNADDKKISLQRKVILSTTKSAGAAMDIKGLKVTIVLAEPFKSEVLAIQTLGRTRDANTYYIDVVDKGFYHCNQYFLSKKKIFSTYALSTELIDLSDIELENRYNSIVKRLADSVSKTQSSILTTGSNKTTMSDSNNSLIFDNKIMCNGEHKNDDVYEKTFPVVMLSRVNKDQFTMRDIDIIKKPVYILNENELIKPFMIE